MTAVLWYVCHTPVCCSLNCCKTPAVQLYAHFLVVHCSSYLKLWLHMLCFLRMRVETVKGGSTA
jgi:hypothetical protein